MGTGLLGLSENDVRAGHCLFHQIELTLPQLGRGIDSLDLDCQINPSLLVVLGVVVLIWWNIDPGSSSILQSTDLVGALGLIIKWASKDCSRNTMLVSVGLLLMPINPIVDGTTIGLLCKLPQRSYSVFVRAEERDSLWIPPCRAIIVDIAVPFLLGLDRHRFFCANNSGFWNKWSLFRWCILMLINACLKFLSSNGLCPPTRWRIALDFVLFYRAKDAAGTLQHGIESWWVEVDTTQNALVHDSDSMGMVGACWITTQIALNSGGHSIDWYPRVWMGSSLW